jgi:hypothetical protein
MASLAAVQVFATILAMITDEINNVMLAARSGKAPVALSGHILLLNWNQQVRGYVRSQLGHGTASRLLIMSCGHMVVCLRNGKAPVALSGHILLLNWNQQVRACMRS